VAVILIIQEVRQMVVQALQQVMLLIPVAAHQIHREILHLVKIGIDRMYIGVRLQRACILIPMKNVQHGLKII